MEMPFRRVFSLVKNLVNQLGDPQQSQVYCQLVRISIEKKTYPIRCWAERNEKISGGGQL